jgi:hypothetical protein
MTNLDAIKAGCWTALFTFVGLFGLSLVGWLQDVTTWASSSGAEQFPDFTTLGYAAVSAATAAVVGLLNAVVRLAQVATGKGTGPTYGA